MRWEDDTNHEQKTNFQEEVVACYTVISRLSRDGNEKNRKQSLAL
jgi:hypothetical protein